MSERNLWPEPWYDSATSPMQTDGPSEVRQSFVKVAMKVAACARSTLINSNGQTLWRLEQALKEFERELGRVT